MGCSDSVVIHPRPLNSVPKQRYNNPSSMFSQVQNTRRPKFLSLQPLHESQRDKLWATIQRNSIKQFAYLLQSQGIPSNVEIGPGNTFWNFAHFCCRWNSFQCLQYIIKRVYAQNSSLILSLMNQQTIQGYTPMHIAIQWNALSCFYLMLDCGGVDLSYTDKMNNDVFASASLFKRQEMLQVLERFKAGNALMVLVQSERVNNFKGFSQLVVAGQAQLRKEYNISSQRIDEIIDTRNRKNRPPLPAPPQNYNHFQTLQNDIKRTQQQKNRNTSNQSCEEGEQTDNMKKLQQQKIFQHDQATIKRQQAEQARIAFQRQREQQLNCLKAQSSERKHQQIMFEQAQLERIQQQKAVIRRNISEMTSNSYQAQIDFNMGNKMTCPQNVRPVYEAALARGTKFVDAQFPAETKSLGNIQDFKFGWQDCMWLRPEQMFPNGQFEIFDGISPDDVKQGTLGVCYYLALLSSIAQNQQRIKRIFNFYDKSLGFYCLQLYLQGRPITMIVDDLIPCMKGTYQPLFAKPSSAQVWVMIFQKAWVKMFGSYLAAENMAPSDMFENVLPAPCIRLTIDVQKIEETFDKLIDYDKKGYIMTASTDKDQQIPQGIVGGHAYSLIGAYNVNGAKLCKVRNPWGKTQYQGMFGDSSPLWTNELISAVSFQKGDDGTFYLNPTELKSLMPSITICLYRDNYEYSHVQITSKSNQDVFYIVNVKSRGQLAMKITQQNQRFLKEMQFENSPIRLQVSRIGQGYDAHLIAQGQSNTMYGAVSLYSNQNIYESFEPGRYLIRLKVMYDRAYLVETRGTIRKFIRGTNGRDVLTIREGKCVLSIYGPEIYIFNRITSQEGYKFMKNVYKNYVLQSGKANQRLKSVGQDLKPTVIAKDCTMRNQIIYFAQNLFPSHSVDFKFKFQTERLRNCSYAFNVNKETESCEWVLKPGEWNLATLQIDCPFQKIATDGYLEPTFKIVR